MPDRRRLLACRFLMWSRNCPSSASLCCPRPPTDKRLPLATKPNPKWIESERNGTDRNGPNPNPNGMTPNSKLNGTNPKRIETGRDGTETVHALRDFLNRYLHGDPARHARRVDLPHQTRVGHRGLQDQGGGGKRAGSPRTHPLTLYIVCCCR